jgi:hypothetical protein
LAARSRNRPRARLAWLILLALALLIAAATRAAAAPTRPAPAAKPSNLGEPRCSASAADEGDDDDDDDEDDDLDEGLDAASRCSRVADDGVADDGVTDERAVTDDGAVADWSSALAPEVLGLDSRLFSARDSALDTSDALLDASEMAIDTTPVGGRAALPDGQLDASSEIDEDLIELESDSAMDRVSETDPESDVDPGDVTDPHSATAWLGDGYESSTIDPSLISGGTVAAAGTALDDAGEFVDVELRHQRPSRFGRLDLALAWRRSWTGTAIASREDGLWVVATWRR